MISSEAPRISCRGFVAFSGRYALLVRRKHAKALHDLEPAARRLRIEHFTVTTEEEVARAQKLGVAPSMTIGHVNYWGEVFHDQQAKVVAPVATLGTKVDELSNDTRSIRENVADLATRLGKLDNKLEDISSAVRTLNQPTNVAPPPPAGAAPGAAGPRATARRGRAPPAYPNRTGSRISSAAATCCS